MYHRFMGYKETYEAYINLSRRELQGLCKKHNLPANKCQSDLAKSLASYFKKMNSSLVDTGEACSVPAKGKSPEKTSDDDHSVNENHHDERLDAEVGNELRATSPIIIKSSQEGINTEAAMDGIMNNLISSTSGVVLRDQDQISQSPTKREQQALPPEPSSDNISLKSQSPTKCQNHVLPSQCTGNDGSTIKNAAESCTVTETAARPASFQLFVASEEGINLFVDLNSGPSDWVQSVKDKICMNPVTQSCSINSLVNDTNYSLSSVHSENFPSESVPLQSIHNLADTPTQNENKLVCIQEGDENERMELSKTVEGDPKEVGEISVCQPNLMVPCQNGDKLAGKRTEPLTEELSVVGPADKVVVLDSPTADNLLSSSDMLDDISVPKASDSSELTLDKNLKRAHNEGSEELSQNRKHRVVKESNKRRNFTKILRSSSTLVKEAQRDNISVLPRRSTRLVSKTEKRGNLRVPEIFNNRGRPALICPHQGCFEPSNW